MADELPLTDHPGASHNALGARYGSHRFAVVGAGSVGVYFAGHLAAAGLDVVSCVRRPFDEYVIESETHPLRHPANAVTEPSAVDGPVEWVLVAVKAHQTVGAAAWFDALCGDSTTVVVMQNGIEGVSRLAPLVHGAEVIPSVVYCGTELVAPGHTRHVSTGWLLVANEPATRRLAALTDASAAEIRIVDDYPTVAWHKLVINALVNGPGALTRKPFQTYANPGMARFGRRLLAEVCAVAVADGAKLDTSALDSLIDRFATATEPGVTSMQQDRLAGRPTEHDAIYGAIIRAAHRHGIDVPTVETVAALVAAGD